MSAFDLSTVRQRRLGAELRRIREEQGLTLEVAARRLNRTPSSLSKIERGIQYARTEFLYYALDKYGVTDQRYRTEIFALAKEARGTGWWQRYGDVLSPSAADYVSLESDAAAIQTYETLVVPGLLQTPAYARTLIQIAQPELSARQFDRFVTFRMARQKVLTRPNPTAYSSVIGEAALRQQVGGKQTMNDQLAKLLEISELENVTIRVLPFSAGAHAGLDGPFEIMDIGGTASFSVAIFENLTGRLFIDANEDVRRYRSRLDRVVAAAMSPEDTRTLVTGLMSES